MPDHFPPPNFSRTFLEVGVKVIIRTRHGADYTIDSMPDEDCLEFVDDFQTSIGRVVTFTMDAVVVHLLRDEMVAIELEPESRPD
jgi:hypothetical protein